MTEMDDCSLLMRTRALLRTTDKPYLQIYVDTGLSPNWLSLFATGKIRSPGVNNVQKLYEYLAGKVLTL
jgi:hypothetical protein